MIKGYNCRESVVGMGRTQAGDQAMKERLMVDRRRCLTTFS